MPYDPKNWHEHSGEVVRFARVLADAGELDGCTGTISYFEKPWKWAPEHARWVDAGCPDALPDEVAPPSCKAASDE